MTAALAQSIVVELQSGDDPEQVITAIRTIHGVAGVKLVFGELRAVVPENAVRPLFDPNPDRTAEQMATPADVIVASAEHFGTTVEMILGPDRHLSVAEARHVAMFICKRRLLRLSYPEIGRAFQRDHTTVMSAVEKLEGFLWVGDLRLERAIEAVMSRLAAVIEKRTKHTKQHTTQGEPAK